jgi:ubiquinol-cytochrome c reductase cytochrome c1 subunit
MYAVVGVCYTEEEAKALASEKEYLDGPDDTGEVSTLPISRVL